MITIHSLIDKWDIKKTLTRDYLFVNILDTLDIYDYEPDFNNTAWLLIKDNDQEMGILIIKDFSYQVLCFHGGVYKQYRTHKLPGQLRLVLDMLKEQYNIKFITTVPATNKAALALDKSIGFKEVYRIPNGCEDCDLVILGED